MLAGVLRVSSSACGTHFGIVYLKTGVYGGGLLLFSSSRLQGKFSRLLLFRLSLADVRKYWCQRGLVVRVRSILQCDEEENPLLDQR